MEKKRVTECQYYRDGYCPESQAIDKCYLIPHLLDISKI
jgi:hypothetical protein